MKQNIFDGLDELKSGERFFELLRRQDVVIERIQSSGHVDHDLYDQAHDEWVILLEGSASLEVNGAVQHLQAGDHVFLPAHTPHLPPLRRVSPWGLNAGVPFDTAFVFHRICQGVTPCRVEVRANNGSPTMGRFFGGTGP